MKLLKPVIIMMLVSLFVTMASMPCYSNTKSDNDMLNENYSHLTKGFYNLNMEVINDIYIDDAVYISETQDKDIVYGKKNIIDLYHKFFDKIKRKNAKIEIDFRVAIRQSSADQSTDIGYYLVRFHPGKESGEPVSEFAGKFVTVSRLTAEGKWKISVDSNTRSKPEFYYRAKPMPNWYYGKQFIQQSTEQPK
ncbi:DUF4440 domain-containing protein [Shewanella glacialimarina]|jgi:ketosteroid isomerase-like protein|uniref:DUF4440 domain-containing protein n=1 Tax=Shewanella glacialimarina TaxID=2590884 RepID=UPI001CF91320|nr:DUF4440 domain-containing protein [Shewanella glacialimarina]UCX04869.1 DUF4440 domain-containing protein [Shewanella glacialimarina]